ncbi:ion channel [Acinetobacter puyangensis]|uniref:Ion channel n=1 Tax=Acinetobacter puyangensis TaxID=1096779 RepID=A0A240EDV1_9GAMM|nr:ion channel [Acinetobacter puyangensis]SNX46095.1 Ion channel [Acinetobacter puyangensis]
MVKQFLLSFWHSLKLLPSAWLLLVQLLILLLAPFTNHSVANSAVSWTLSAIALLLVAKIMRTTTVYTTVTVISIAPALCLSIAVALGFDSKWMVISANLFEAFAYMYAAYGLSRYMFHDRYLTRDELFAAASVFTLMVWSFAFLYSACQAWDYHSFNLVQDTARSWLGLLYLSFSVQSGTGLSDIYPQADLARVIVSLQMFCGVMYLTLIVSRLIALQYIKHLPRSKEDDQ